MGTETSNVAIARRLCLAWEDMLLRDPLSEEVAYRIGKLVDRAEPIQGKAFLKTGKGQEMLGQCLEMTLGLRGLLAQGDAPPWAALTELEVLFEELLLTAYAFRVRAG